MIDFALGLVEVKGLVGAIEAADTMVKTSNVKLIARERTDPAMITIKIIGDTAAVRAAVEAGAAAAERVSKVISKHVIPRPADGMEELIFAKTFLQQEDIDLLLGVSSPEEISNSSQQEEEESETEATREILIPDTMEKKEYVSKLAEMTVPQLRNYARKVEGLSIYGRQISIANKDELIKELLKAKFGE